MLNVELTYNPYLVKTSIVMNGEELTDSHDLMIPTKNKRIQVWIDSFFKDIVETQRDNKIKLIAHCTPQDAEDIKNALANFENGDLGQHCTIEFISNTKTQSVGDKIEALHELLQKAQDGPFEEFKDDTLRTRFEEALAPEFEVNVIATMSSGKSTVINAFIGQEMMPAKNEACTATIAYIEDCDGMEGFEGCCKDSAGEIIEDWQNVDVSILEDWNLKEGVSTLELKGDIVAIKESSHIRLVLVDTPGPNNSRDQSHRKKTYEAISSKPLSMVLYVLNATQLNINDDAVLLDDVAKAMSAGGRQAQDRFVFIANKIDCFDPEKGESVESAVENIRKYLKHKGIDNPIIIPASAELVKLIRMERSGQTLTRSQRNDLKSNVELFVEEEEMNMLKHSKPSISTISYKILSDRLKSTESNEEKAEILSGIPIIEELLAEFLIKHAVPAKIKDAVDSFAHVMQKAEGLERLNEQLGKDELELKKIVEQLESFAESQERIKAAQDFRGTVRATKYCLSKKLKETYEGILEKQFTMMEELTDLFGDAVDPCKAETMIANCTNKCVRFNNEVEKTIADGLKTEYIEVLEGLRDDYKTHVENLLEKEFPDVGNSDLLAFQKQALAMPDVKSLVKSNTFVEKTLLGTQEVSDSTWYKPWTWRSKRTVKVYDHKDKVKVGPIWEGIGMELTKNTQSNIDASKKQAASQAEKGKKLVLQAMDEIDRVWDETLTQMKTASANKGAREKAIQDNKKKLAWYNDFSKELQGILSI